MPFAPGYIGWAHKRHDRSQADVAPYIPQARKVLGFAVQEAARNGLLTYKVRQELADGTLLIGEVIGGQPRMTIIPAARGGEERRVYRDGFVTWARDADNQDGIDADYPQQILRPGTKEWGVYTKDENTAGRRTGTYGAQFPDGITRAGNVDWTGPYLERISWYGPTARYFIDGWVQPQKVYGTWVFMLGKVVLDVEQYAVDSEEAAPSDPYILGAGIADVGGARWLYVFQSSADDVPTPIPPAAGEVTGYYTAPIPNSTYTATLYRYALTEVVDSAGVRRYEVEPHSRELMGSVSATACEPWTFSTDGMTAVSYGNKMLDDTWYASLADHVYTQPSDLTEAFPATAQIVYTLTLDEDGNPSIATADSSVTSGGADANVATDFRDDERIDLKLRIGSDLIPRLVLDDLVVPFSSTYTDGDSTALDRRMLIAADLRIRLLVFFRIRSRFLEGTGSNPDTGAGATIEVYHRGLLVHESEAITGWAKDPCLGYATLLFPTATKHASLAGVAVSPAFWTHGAILLYQAAPDPETGLSSSATFELVGFGCSCAALPRAAADYYGYFDRSIFSTEVADPISSMCTPGFASEQLDKDGRQGWAGCVGDDEVVLVSSFDPRQAAPGDLSYSFATDTTLAALTGIGGDNARYHPLWTLGKQPKTTEA